MGNRKESIGEFIHEVLVTTRDNMLEPIRFSQALKNRLTDTTKIPDWDNLDQLTKTLVHIRGYGFSYLPITMPIAMGLGLITEGNVVSGILLTTITYMFEGAMLKILGTRGQH